MIQTNLLLALEVLKMHHLHFFQGYKYASFTGQPAPEDSRAWSQILISVLTGIRGLARKKGPDLEDGSDVKSANAWFSIDKVRFNGVIKAGTQSNLAGTMSYLDQMPYIFFVLWDYEPKYNRERVRIWVVQPKCDILFRNVAQRWYDQLAIKTIRSNNFQLHPPINENSNVFTNMCGNLEYPLLLDARWNGRKYVVVDFLPNVFDFGYCKEVV